MSIAPYFMPAPWIVRLAQIHPLAPNVVISLGLSGMLGALLFALLQQHRVRRCQAASRRRRILALNAIARGLAGSTVVVASVLLPIMVSCTGLVLSTPAAASTNVTSPDAARIAYRNVAVTIVADKTGHNKILFYLDNYYSQSVFAQASVVRNDEGVLVSWDLDNTVTSGNSKAWRGTLLANSAGTYYVEFQMQVSGQPGVLKATSNVLVEVTATP
jgi:uncharacterized membrane protein